MVRAPTTNIGFALYGKEDVERALKRFRTSVAQRYMRESIREAVQFVRKELTAAIPKPGPGNRNIWETGALRAAIRSGRYRTSRAFASGYVWIGKKGGYQAHLIEYGHRQFAGKGRKKKLVGFIPANPFFRPTIDNNKEQILRIFRERLEQLVKGGV